jgi:hypothetical protein
MPLIEGQIGQALQDLIERNVAALKSNLRWKEIDSEQGHWLLQTVFWLVSAKILRDKEVPAFDGLELVDVDEVFTRLAQHYNAAPIRILDQRQRDALAENDDGTIEALNEDGERLVDKLRLDSPDRTRFRRPILDTLRSFVRNDERALFVSWTRYPEDLPDLRRKHEPGNSRPEGREQCCFARRERGSLPETY